MHEPPKESDWKQFRKMVPGLRERWLQERNQEIARLLTAPDRTPTEQFWDAEEQFGKDVRTLEVCFDDHRRSKLVMTLVTMVRCGVLKDQDLEGFSDELRERLQNVKFL